MAGLIFDNVNNTVTPSDSAQNSIATFEGCSSISDPAGNLLFYSDGRDVWDANHQLMPNADYYSGSGLLGDPSSTSSAVIIPKPGDTNKYFIFTVTNHITKTLGHTQIQDLPKKMGHQPLMEPMIQETAFQKRMMVLIMVLIILWLI